MPRLRGGKYKPRKRIMRGVGGAIAIVGTVALVRGTGHVEQLGVLVEDAVQELQELHSDTAMAVARDIAEGRVDPANWERVD
jgi:uncharacterized membrane protein